MKKIYKGEQKIIFFATLVMIIYLEPQIFKENSFVGVELFDRVYKILKLISFFFTFLIYTKVNKFNVSKLLILTALLQGTFFISTIINHGDLMRFIGPAITTINVVMICEILIKKKIIIDVLKKVNIYLWICFFINLISIILIDCTAVSEYVSVYFLGIDNRFLFTFIPWITFEGIVSYKQSGKLNNRWKLVVILCEGVSLYKFSVSAMICLALYFILFFKFSESKNYAKYSTGLLYGYFVLNILFLKFKIQEKFKHYILVLGKDMTLSGRTFIWDGVFKMLKEKVMLGNGMQSLEYDKNFFYNSTSPYFLEFCKVTHAHNSIMTVLYRGGVISAAIYIYILFYVAKKIKENKDTLCSSLFLVSFLIILITSIFDTIDFAMLYFIFTLIVNSEVLNKILIKNEKFNFE